MSTRPPALPDLLNRKIYKTGQTRGADDDVIYQNRVARNSTVLIPYTLWTTPFPLPHGEKTFENGLIVLISPDEYFRSQKIKKELLKRGLRLGVNTLVFYETRDQWNRYNPKKFEWKPAEKRVAPLGGNYVARVPATTSSTSGGKIIRGFTSTATKGAGIRVFEYASTKTMKLCRYQLEALFWLCPDSEKVVSANRMRSSHAARRKKEILDICLKNKLLDYDKLNRMRVINNRHRTICPLCLQELSGEGFFARMQQAVGREVPDLTVTEINLFHIEELRNGVYNHHPYNVGWGHHHCNVVVKDSGVQKTLEWMSSVLENNIESGHFQPGKRASC